MQILLGNTNISSVVTSFIRTQSCRAENVTYTVNGTSKIDRMGGFKTTINLAFGDISTSEWRTICALLKALPIAVTVTDNDTLTYSMHLAAELPETYVYSDSEGDHVIGATAVLEEI